MRNLLQNVPAAAVLARILAAILLGRSALKVLDIRRVLAPRAAQHDRDATFPIENFRDMHAERDYLRNFGFKRLEERLRERCHYLDTVDLRQGVENAHAADEAARELQVLPVCLGESERSRPVPAAVDSRDISNVVAPVTADPVLPALPSKSGLFYDDSASGLAGTGAQTAGQPTISVTLGWQNLSTRPYFKLYFVA